MPMRTKAPPRIVWLPDERGAVLSQHSPIKMKIGPQTSVIDRRIS